MDDEARPWHGTENPFEAMYQHFTAEIEVLKAKLFPAADEPAVSTDPAAVPAAEPMASTADPAPAAVVVETPPAA